MSNRSLTNFYNESKVYQDVIQDSIKERIENFGFETLTTAELLSSLTGVSLLKTKTQLDNYGLLDFVKMINSFDITKRQKQKIKLVFELTRRVSTYQNQKLKIDSPEKAGNFFINDLRLLEIEVFKIMLLNTRNELISIEECSRGTVNQAYIHVRNILQTALNKNATSAILAHVHPGGSIEPSVDDIALTTKLQEAFKYCGIKIIDHIIVGNNNYFSFAENQKL